MSKVSPSVAEILQQHVVEKSVAAGVSIEKQGDQPSVLTLIKFGLFKCERINASGDRAAVCVMGRGRIAGYTGLFKQPAIMSLTALGPARVCEIPISVVYDKAFVERDFRQYIYRMVGAHMENVAEWAGLVRESNISKRLLAAFDLLAQEEGSRTIRIPSHVELGSLVVARRESVARHIAALLRDGKLVKLDRWRAILRPTTEELGAPTTRLPKHRSRGLGE
jgi:CRP-like cAMP-binding protein